MNSESAIKYREKLIQQICDLADELKERAPDLVGEGDAITSFKIHLIFPQPDEFCPSIKVVREHLSTTVIKRFFDENDVNG